MKNNHDLIMLKNIQSTLYFLKENEIDIKKVLKKCLKNKSLTIGLYSIANKLINELDEFEELMAEDIVGDW